MTNKIFIALKPTLLMSMWRIEESIDAISIVKSTVFQ